MSRHLLLTKRTKRIQKKSKNTTQFYFRQSVRWDSFCKVRVTLLEGEASKTNLEIRKWLFWLFYHHKNLKSYSNSINFEYFSAKVIHKASCALLCCAKYLDLCAILKIVGILEVRSKILHSEPRLQSSPKLEVSTNCRFNYVFL